MAAFTYTQAAILLGGFAAESFVRSFNFAAEATQQDATTFGSGGFRQYVPGVKGATFELGGVQDFDSAAFSTYLAGGVGAQYPITVSIPGSAEGDPAWVGRGLTNRNGPVVGGDIDALGEFSLAMVSDSRFGRGFLLQPYAEQSTADNSTGIAWAGPTAAQSLYVALHVGAVSSGTWTVIVESDGADDFASATTRLTFSTFTAQGWQFQSVAGDWSSETHLRVAWSVAGGSSPTASFAVAAFIV